MKKLMKKLSLGLALAVCLTLCVPAVGTTKLFAANGFSTDVKEFSIPAFQQTGKKGVTYNIAQATIGSTPITTDYVTVTDPYGREVTVTSLTFMPEYAGNYTITYIDPADENNKTSLVAQIKGISEGEQITFAKNDKYIIPSIVNPNNNGANLEVVLPVATVVDEDGEEIQGATVEISATFSDSTNTTWAFDADYAVDSVTHGKLTLDKNAEGIYVVTYKYVVGTTTITTKTFKIQADTDYNNGYKLTYGFDSPKPTTAQIGVETKLPVPEGQNADLKTDNDVEIYYDVTAKITTGESTIVYTANDTDANKKGVITFNEEEGCFYFKPVKEGDYTITYTVKNFFGTTASVSTNEFTITDVKDSTAPTPIAVAPYATDANGYLADYTLASDAIQSYTDAENIILMPIYAKDNANGIVNNNLTLYRTIENSLNKVIFDERDLDGTFTHKVLVFNAVSGIENGFTIKIAGEPIQITADQIKVITTADMKDSATIESGKFNAYYYADDKAGNGVNSTIYEIVVSSEADTEAPKITFTQNLPTAMFIEDKITFTAPTVTDNKDKRLSIYVDFQVEVNASGTFLSVEDSEDYGTLTYDEDKNSYTFVLDATTAANVSQVKIIANAEDDSENLGTSEQVIKVLNTGDASATTITSSNGYDNTQTFVQGDEITLPTVVYADDLVDYVNVEIIIENNGTFFTAYDAVVARDAAAGTVTVSGAHFNASLSGLYTVTYKSVDAGNNHTVIVYELEIAENTAGITANFVGLPSEINGGKVEKGEQISLAIPSVDTKTESLYAEYRVVVGGPVNATLSGNYFFTANVVGTYTIKYIADIYYTADDSFHSTIESKEYKIEVVDTTAPKFEDFEEIEAYFAELVAKYPSGEGTMKTDVGTILDLPIAETLADDLDLEKSYITIASSNSTDTFYYNNLSNYKKAFTQNDVYTITFTLVDTFGNKSSKSVTLEVGDVKAPEVSIEDSILEDTYNIGDQVEIDLSKISVNDNIDGKILLYNEDTKVFYIDPAKTKADIKITITNTTTNTVIDNALDSSKTDLRFAYNITEAGEYTVKIEISDNSGKTYTNTDFSFTVSSDENAGLDAEEILGIVLIIVSVLLLGGVVTYFIVTRKNIDKKYR